MKPLFVKSFNLRGGHTTTDRRLDRLPQFDERSRLYGIRELVGMKPLRSYTWRCDAWLDQGREGACVGFSWAHELAARPVAIKGVTALTGKRIYESAQKRDDIPGEDYEGTSVLAGAKAVQFFGYIESYRWAFSLNELLLALGYAGPVVLGINWYASMFATDAAGRVHVGGELAGGHAILANRVALVWRNPQSPKVMANVDMDKSTIRLHNSWGKTGWGINGDGEVSLTDTERLLNEDGEACIPVGRRFKLAE